MRLLWGINFVENPKQYWWPLIKDTAGNVGGGDKNIIYLHFLQF